MQQKPQSAWQNLEATMLAVYFTSMTFVLLTNKKQNLLRECAQHDLLHDSAPAARMCSVADNLV